MSHRVVPSLPLGHGFSLVYRHTFIQWPHNQDRVKNASIQESFKTLCKIRCMKWSPILVTSHRILQLTFIAAHMHLINGSQNCVLNLIMYKEEELTPYVKVAAKKTNFVKLNLDRCCVLGLSSFFRLPSFSGHLYCWAYWCILRPYELVPNNINK